MQTALGQLRLQNVPDQFDDILSCRGEMGQRRVTVQIAMIEPIDDSFVDQLVETA